MTPKVVLYAAENGNVTVYFDEGVQVFWVDDRAPQDRVYEMSQRDVPDGLVDGPVGRAGDGSPAEARAFRAVAEHCGERHLKPVK